MIENTGRFAERNAMFSEICGGFLFIPLKDRGGGSYALSISLAFAAEADRESFLQNVPRTGYPPPG